MIKSHKIQLLPNNKQKAHFNECAGIYRFAYNYGLQRKIDEYHNIGKSPGAYSLAKEITCLKKTSKYFWLNYFSKSVPRVALQHLDESYRNFFRGIKNKGMVGFPKFKSKKRSKKVFHLEVSCGNTAIKNRSIRIPKLGWVRMRQNLRFKGKLVGTVAISEKCGKWYASFSVEVEANISDENQVRDVGIDLGIKKLAVLSDGITYNNPRFFSKLQRLLARAQRQMARKQKDSKQYQKAKLRVARIHKKISDLRNNSLHHITKDISSKYKVVYLEDLNVESMMDSYFAKEIADVSMREFRRQITYKQEWQGGEVILVDRYFPSSKTCSGCGSIKKDLKLSDRQFNCDCGLSLDRDLNAARNILNCGRKINEIAECDSAAGRLAGTGREGLATIAPQKRQQSRKFRKTLTEVYKPVQILFKYL